MTVEEIISVSVPGGKITEEGVRVNIDVALQYLNSWLSVNKQTCYISSIIYSTPPGIFLQKPASFQVIFRSILHLVGLEMYNTS